MVRYYTIVILYFIYYPQICVIYLFSIRKLQINTYISSMANITEVNKLIEETCNELKELLIQKNIDYNNSLQNPIQVFSKSAPIDGILSRLDDKLNRIKKKGINDKTEDTIMDIMGYLVHLKIAKKLL
jgi:hypothetical protein